MPLDTGDTSFMLVATALVMIMTPGLAFFYGGLVSRKNVLAIMMQSYVSMGVTTILWVTVGYSLCFSGGAGGVIGDLDLMFLKGIVPSDLFGGMPLLLFVVYQMMFAVITPALITGAFAGRITFKAYLIFLVAWQLFVYFPFVHMIWGGGMLADWGVLDFAGGIVVHALAGMAALASVMFVGSRKDQDEAVHNVPFVALGAALLWFGWFGFNAGSALDVGNDEVGSIAVLAFINTQIAAAFAAITWLLLAWHYDRKPSFVEMLIGMIAGLATITPAAGFVSPQSAMLIGVAAGAVCYFAVVLRKKYELDDALDVWGVHGVGGALGIVLLGVLASENINGQNGLYYGDSDFFLVQLAGLALACVWAFAVTYGMLWGIDKVTPVRVSEETERTGLDEALHGELGYTE